MGTYLEWCMVNNSVNVWSLIVILLSFKDTMILYFYLTRITNENKFKIYRIIIKKKKHFFSNTSLTYKYILYCIIIQFLISTARRRINHLRDSTSYNAVSTHVTIIIISIVSYFYYYTYLRATYYCCNMHILLWFYSTYLRTILCVTVVFRVRYGHITCRMRRVSQYR